MNIVQYNPEFQLENSTFKISEAASELIKKFHQSPDGLTLQNWKALSEILDYAAAAEQKIADQKDIITTLESIAVTDLITGLMNRFGFENEIIHAIARAKRYEETSLFVYIDLDNFKAINDTYGHNAGDAMLKRVGTILEKFIRKTDAAARLSGDEFGLLLTKCDIDKAKDRAGLIRHNLKKITLNYEDIILHTSASMGFAVINQDSPIEDIFNASDKAMYKNKRSRKSNNKKYQLT